MADSIREQIIAAVKTTLEGATIAGGYHNDLNGRVSRQLRHWDECLEFPQVFITAGTEAKSQLTTSYTESELTLVIRGYEHDPEGADTKLNNLIQDVEKVLMVDPTLGALASWLEAVDLETDEGWLTPHGVFEFRFTATYRYARGAP